MMMVSVVFLSCYDALRRFLPQGEEHRGQQVPRHGESRFTRTPETHRCGGRFYRAMEGIARWVLQSQDRVSYGADCITTRTTLLYLMPVGLAAIISVRFAQRAIYPFQECVTRFVHRGHASGSLGRRLSFLPPLIAPTPGIDLQAAAGFSKR